MTSGSSGVSDIRLMDIRKAKDDWAFKTGELLDVELRNAHFVKDRMMLTGGAEEDYLDAVYQLTVRKRQRMLSEYKTELEDRFNREKLDADHFKDLTAIEEAKKDLDLTIQQSEAARGMQLKESQEALTDADREIRMRRESQDLSHSNQLMNEKLNAELSSKERTNAAYLKEKRDAFLEEINEKRETQKLENERSETAMELEEKKLDNASSRDIKKIETLAEIERMMAEQDSLSEINRIEAMREMSADAILALQASDIAKQASPETVAKVVENIKGDKVNKELYERLLEEKEISKAEISKAISISNEALVKNNAAIIEALSRSSETKLDGYKQAAENAKSTNEKSMENMAKVASKAASNNVISSNNSVNCINSDCSHIFSGKIAKYCPICGTAQS